MMKYEEPIMEIIVLDFVRTDLIVESQGGNGTTVEGRAGGF